MAEGYVFSVTPPKALMTPTEEDLNEFHQSVLPPIKTGSVSIYMSMANGPLWLL